MAAESGTTTRYTVQITVLCYLRYEVVSAKPLAQASILESR